VAIFADMPRSCKSTIEQRFALFHRDNPEIYVELVDLARVAKGHGRTRIGIRHLWEVMRWNRFIKTNRPDGDFKLNDHFHSRYVRLIIAENPDLASIFETRTLRAP